MSQPPLMRCPRCQRHVTVDSPACPFCAAPIAALGRGFGAPNPALPPPAPPDDSAPLRPEATLYGLPPLREADLPQRLADEHVPMPAYGMPPLGYPGQRRWGMVALMLLLAVMTAFLVFTLVLR